MSNNVKFNILLFLIFILIILFVNACTILTVNNDDVPVSIKENGAFVSKGELINMANGQWVTYRNHYTKRKYYYLPPLYFVEKDGKIRLRTESE